MSPEEIKSKIIDNIRYSITYWPESNIYQIHSHDLRLDGNGVAHAELEIAKFNNEKEAIEYYEGIK